MNKCVASVCLAAAMLIGVDAGSASAQNLASLTGTWTMVSAYELHPNGSRSTNYGEHPLGLLIVDASGRYSLQIFRIGRPRFVSGDKARGTPDQYRQAVIGSSTHFGTVSIDQRKHRLTFTVEAASFPNWEGQKQVRDYTFTNGLLTYAVPASASSSGIVAYSIWRREAP